MWYFLDIFLEGIEQYKINLRGVGYVWMFNPAHPPLFSFKGWTRPFLTAALQRYASRPSESKTRWTSAPPCLSSCTRYSGSGRPSLHAPRDTLFFCPMTCPPIFFSNQSFRFNMEPFLPQLFGTPFTTSDQNPTGLSLIVSFIIPFPTSEGPSLHTSNEPCQHLQWSEPIWLDLRLEGTPRKCLAFFFFSFFVWCEKPHFGHPNLNDWLFFPSFLLYKSSHFCHLVATESEWLSAKVTKRCSEQY